MAKKNLKLRWNLLRRRHEPKHSHTLKWLRSSLRKYLMNHIQERRDRSPTSMDDDCFLVCIKGNIKNGTRLPRSVKRMLSTLPPFALDDAFARLKESLNNKGIDV